MAFCKFLNFSRCFASSNTACRVFGHTSWYESTELVIYHFLLSSKVFSFWTAKVKQLNETGKWKQEKKLSHQWERLVPLVAQPFPTHGKTSEALPIFCFMLCADLGWVHVLWLQKFPKSPGIRTFLGHKNSKNPHRPHLLSPEPSPCNHQAFNILTLKGEGLRVFWWKNP